MYSKFIFVLLAALAFAFAGTVDCNVESNNCTIDTSKCVALQTLPTGSNFADYLCELTFSYETTANMSTVVPSVDFSISGLYGDDLAAIITTLPDAVWPSDYPKPAYWLSAPVEGSYPVQSHITEDLGGKTKVTFTYKTMVMRGAHICINIDYFDPKYRLADIRFNVKHDDVEVDTFYEHTALWSTGDISPEYSGVIVAYENGDESDINDSEVLQLVDSVPKLFKFELKNPLDMPFSIPDASWFIGSIISDLAGDNVSPASSEVATLSSSSSSDSSNGLDKFVEMIKFRVYTCSDAAYLADMDAHPDDCKEIISMNGAVPDVPTCESTLAAFSGETINEWFGLGTDATCAQIGESNFSNKLSAIDITAGMPIDFSINPPSMIFPLTISNLPGSINIGLSLDFRNPLESDAMMSILNMRIAVTSEKKADKVQTSTTPVPNVDSVLMKYDTTMSDYPYVEVKYSKPIVFTHVAETVYGEDFNCVDVMRVATNARSKNNKCRINDAHDTLYIFPSYQGASYSFPLRDFINNGINALKSIDDIAVGQDLLDIIFVAADDEKAKFEWASTGNGVIIGEDTSAGDIGLYLRDGGYANVLADMGASWKDSSLTTWASNTNFDVAAPAVAIEKGDDYTHITFTFESFHDDIAQSAMKSAALSVFARQNGKFKGIKNFYDNSRKTFVTRTSFDSSKFELLSNGKLVLHAFVSEYNDVSTADFIFFHPLINTIVVSAASVAHSVYNPSDHVNCVPVRTLVREESPELIIKCSRPVRTPTFIADTSSTTVDAPSNASIKTKGNNVYITVTGDDALDFINVRTTTTSGTRTGTVKLSFGDVEVSKSISVEYRSKEVKVTELFHSMNDGRVTINTKPEFSGDFTITGETAQTGTYARFNLAECRSVSVDFASESLSEAPATLNLDLYPKVLNGMTGANVPTFVVKDKDGVAVAASGNLNAREKLTVEVTMPWAAYATHTSSCAADIQTAVNNKAFYNYRVIVTATVNGKSFVLSRKQLANSNVDTPSVSFKVPFRGSGANMAISVAVEVSTKYKYMGTLALDAVDFTLLPAAPVSFADFANELESILTSSAVNGFTSDEVLSVLSATATSGTSDDDVVLMKKKKAALVVQSASDMDLEDTARAINSLSDSDVTLDGTQALSVRNAMTTELASTSTLDLTSDEDGEGADRIKTIASNAEDIPPSINTLYHASRGVTTQATEVEGTAIDAFAHDATYFDPVSSLSTILAMSATISADSACSATPVTDISDDNDPSVVITKFSTGATATGLSSVVLPESFFTAAGNLLSSSACMTAAVVQTDKPTSSVYARTTMFNGSGELESGYLQSTIATVGFSNSEGVDMRSVFTETTGMMEITLDLVEDSPKLTCMSRLTTGSWAPNGCTVKEQTNTQITCSCPVSRVVRSSSSAIAAFSDVPGLESASNEGGLLNAFGGSLGVLTIACIGGALVLGVLGMLCGARSSAKREKVKGSKKKKVSPL